MYSLTLPPGKLFPLLCCLLSFFKINFFEKFFQEYHQSVKQFVGPDLGPNCLQVTADDTRRLRVKIASMDILTQTLPITYGIDRPDQTV